jgi:hypothetical protein
MNVATAHFWFIVAVVFICTMIVGYLEIPH